MSFLNYDPQNFDDKENNQRQNTNIEEDSADEGTYHSQYTTDKVLEAKNDFK